MSRKSLAAVSTVAVLPGQRAQPPTKLTKEQAEVWRRVAATKPPEWFTPDSWDTLAQYCRYVVTTDRLQAQIDVFESLDAETTTGMVLAYGKALEARDNVTAKLMALARSMRLTQQSRAKAETAATAHNSTAKKKLWEIA